MHHIVTVETYSLDTGVLLVTLRPDMTGFSWIFFLFREGNVGKYLQYIKISFFDTFPVLLFKISFMSSLFSL